ncbi:Protein dispatched-like 1 [Hondaea fermentalgiana]|uniref:Protein dispatched-like 1 n=1 Tax=Hondaea fermentalgiana TaxID=2315210 RepID=A0A2R5GVG7_9STRA|nr:Protein dispatched-like 1 [Hondaea fermentalgiana]|eukprot:GBG34319.1 Protein dispatched-like 1 [Hondaea fermentalgiana]
MSEKMAGGEEKEELQVSYSGELRMVEKASRHFVKRPRTICGSIWAAFLVMSAVVYFAGWFDIADTTVDDWTIPTSEASKNGDALSDAREKMDSAQSTGNLPARSEDVWFTATSFIYEWADDRQAEILTPDNLQRMCQFQSILTADENFPKYCKPDGAALGKDTVCASQDYDVVALVYPTFEEQKECRLLNSTEFATQFAALASEPEKVFFFLERRVTSLLDVRLKTRSQISLYAPLGADSTDDGKAFGSEPDDDAGPQGVIYENFLATIEKKFFASKGLEVEVPFNSAYNIGAFDLGNGLQVRFYNQYFVSSEFDRMVGYDQALVAGSIVLVFITMILHLRSLFMSSVGLLSILISIVVALFFYTGIFRIEYFSSVHIVTFFLILGIGADDLFVWVDAYYQSERYWPGVRGFASKEEAGKANVYGTNNEEDEVLVARLTYTYQRAAGAVLNTSATTAGAFLATGVSPIAPIASFGIFAAITIMLNFVWTIILYPAVVIIFEKYFRGRYCCCGCLRAPRDKVASASQDIEQSAATHIEKRVAEDGTVTLVMNKVKHKENFEEKVFSKGYVPLINKQVSVTIGGRTCQILPVVAVTVTALFALIVTMATFAVQLGTPTEPDQNFRSSHMSTGYATDYSKLFQGGTDYLEVDVTFGIEGIDRGSFKFLDPNGYRGAVVFDTEFDLSSRTNQEYYLEVCDSFETLSCVPEGETSALAGCIGSDVGLATRSVDCTLRKFHDWHNETYPLETPAIDLGEVDKALWTSRLSEFANATGADNDIGIVDGELKFIVFSYEASLKTLQPVGVKEPVIDLLEAHLQEMVENAPAGLESAFQTSFDMLWIHTELGIVSGMFQGLAISVPIAFVVLLFATSNLILSVIAIFGIIGIVVTVLGTAQLLGWALGVAEAIAAVMVVGLSVDYSTLHGTSYAHAAGEGFTLRADRFKYSAVMLGPTVIAGAFTTGGSAAIMFFAQLQFFGKMAILLTSTIAYSLIITEFFVMPLFRIIGPENDRGDWRLWLKARGICNKKK